MTITSAAAPSAHDAYESTADVYDAFTAHHDYEQWTAMIERLGRRHGLAAAGRMLDVGCGTGKSFLPWLARGWSVTGCDQSRAMLRRARPKAPEVPLLEADFRDLPEIGRFDLVLALDDVVNCLSADERDEAFEGAARNLAPEGRFVFDLNTLHCYRTFFAATEPCEGDGWFAVWRGTATGDFGPGETAEAILDAFVETPGGCWQRRRAVHRQHHHPLPAVDAALERAGLRRVAVYGQDQRCNAEPRLDEVRHTKAIVIAGA